MSKQTQRLLPKLKKSRNNKKKYHYKLNYTPKRRRMAINEGINYETKHTRRNRKQAAIAKKGRLNILRIYRRNKKNGQCNKITSDMRYIDRKYNLGKTKNICMKGGKRKTRKQKQFLYNPNNPKKSFDVYIDKEPSDTINIKYTTVDDVKNTIRKLERLFKSKKYSHKRIWQVGMIMRVRLQAMLKHKNKLYSKAKNVKQRYQIAERYFKFLGERSKKKTFEERKNMVFKL